MRTAITVLYDALADLLAYPGEGYHQNVARCRQALGEHFPEAAAHLGRFAAGVVSQDAGELEELYTRTFDMNPSCALEVGWHLFGENYSRGEFLVKMREELRQRGLAETTELPDHLTLVLPVAARMEQRQADRFTSRYLLPALEKIQAGLVGQDSPYASVVEAIRCVLTSPYGMVV